jgi:hypothetical protein
VSGKEGVDGNEVETVSSAGKSILFPEYTVVSGQKFLF